MAHPNPTDLYPISTAATLTGVGRTTLQAAFERGEFPPHRLGNGTPVVLLRDVRKWMATNRPLGRPRLTRPRQ